VSQKLWSAQEVDENYLAILTSRDLSGCTPGPNAALVQVCVMFASSADKVEDGSFLVELTCGAVLSPFAAKAGDTVPVFAREMLSAHNALRQKTGVPPLKWSNILAVRAAEWAKKLAATGASKMQGIPGQNIGYTSRGRVDATGIVAAWTSEVTNYDHEKNACIDPRRGCHHYTQIVWRDTAYLGCAAAHDKDRDIWVCDYDPPGNNIAERPY
jgi:pathogenesis-related protein 1